MVMTPISPNRAFTLGALALLGMMGCTGEMAINSTPPIVTPDPDAAMPRPIPDPTPPAMGDDLPCEVARVVAEHCGGCHSETPSFGAPMPLAARADFLTVAPTDPSRQLSTVISERVQDDRRPMPPNPHVMPEADQQILLDWVTGGFIEREAGVSCDDVAPPDLTDGVGPEHLPCEPTHTFRASDPADPSLGFPIPASRAGNPNTYVCFPIPNPFGDGEQATDWAPVIDNEAVLHHWILWGSNQPARGTGPIPCAVLPASDAAFITGWAPGGQNGNLPDNVGLDLSFRTYYLQLHYWNPSGTEGLRDQSGVAFCTTPTPREHTAGVLTLGDVRFNLPPRSRDIDVEFECPGWVMSGFGQLNILSSGPHMHQLATSFLSEIIRADGSREDIGRVDSWDFDNQTSIPFAPPLQIRNGDRLGIRCTYDNPHDFPVGFGEGSEDEMCFDFLLVYPIEHIPAARRGCIGLL